MSPSRDLLSCTSLLHTLVQIFQNCVTLVSGGGIVADTQTDSISMFMETMQRLLVAGEPTPDDIVLPERLDRASLDFSLESLQQIDEYLNVVHEHEQNSVGSSLLTTIWVVSIYIGEIIRRAAPARQYEWVTIGDESPASGGCTASQMDLASLRALRAQDGELCLPSRAVLRVILRGCKARSVYSFACGAIESPSVAPATALSANAELSALQGLAAFG